MKKYLFLLTILFLWPSVCSASWTGVYRLNGNSNDISSSANNGTDNTVSYRAGRVGQAAFYTGATPSCTALGGSSVPQKSGIWTYSYIMRADVAPANREPVSYVSSQGSSGSWSGFENSWSNVSSTAMWNFYAANAYKSALAKPSSISVGSWYHIVFSNDGTSMKMYQNGRLVTSTPSGGNTIWSKTVYPRIGCAGYTTQYFYWKGGVDEYTIQNVVDNNQAIKTRYQLTFGKLE